MYHALDFTSWEIFQNSHSRNRSTVARRQCDMGFVTLDLHCHPGTYGSQSQRNAANSATSNNCPISNIVIILFALHSNVS